MRRIAIEKSAYMSALTLFNCIWVDRKGFVGAMCVDHVCMHDSFDTFRNFLWVSHRRGCTYGYVQWAMGFLLGRLHRMNVSFAEIPGVSERRDVYRGATEPRFHIYIRSPLQSIGNKITANEESTDREGYR